MPTALALGDRVQFVDTCRRLALLTGDIVETDDGNGYVTVAVDTEHTGQDNVRTFTTPRRWSVQVANVHLAPVEAVSAR